MEFGKLLEKRNSIRDYSNKKVKIDLILKAIEATNQTPCPGNLPVLKFLIIKKPEIIEGISEACQQKFIKHAKFIVVFCSDNEKIEIMYEERAKKYIQQHSGAAIENFLLKITEMNLASCWVGAFSELIIKKLLKIPKEIEIQAIFPIAYRNNKIKVIARRKINLDNRVYFETWENKYKNKPKKIRN